MAGGGSCSRNCPPLPVPVSWLGLSFNKNIPWLQPEQSLVTCHQHSGSRCQRILGQPNIRFYWCRCLLMTVEVTSQFEVITPRILLLCQEGSSLWRGKGPGANDDQDNYQSVTNSQSASCILSWVPSVEQNCGRFMDKMGIIKRICSIDCILNDQCDDGITLTLSCVFIFYIFNSISSPGPGYGLTPLLLCYSTLPQDTHPLSLSLVAATLSRHTGPGRGQRSIQSEMWRRVIALESGHSTFWEDCWGDHSFLSQLPGTTEALQAGKIK